MTPADQQLVEYIGAMFGAIPGGYLGVLEGLSTQYGGNLHDMMRDLSGSSAFQAVLPAGATDREIAFDFVNRIVEDTASPANKEWAVNWFADQHASGRTWGEIVFDAVQALDGISGGAWGATADMLRTRASYAAASTDGWASSVTDLGVLRDVYSYAISSVMTGTQYPNTPAPMSVLANASTALAAAAAGIASHSGDETYTITAADQGKALMFGAGNDTVTVGYADLLRPTFVSGGDGTDTLVVTGSGTDYGNFLNAYHGFTSVLPYRGFEKLVFPDHVPLVIGSLDGVKVVTMGAGDVGCNTDIASVDTGTVFNIQANGASKIQFFEYGAYDNVGVLNVPGPLASPPQVVDSLTFNITAGESSSLTLIGLNAKEVTWNIHGSATSVYTAPLPISEPNLEVLNYSSNLPSGGSGNTSPLVLAAPHLSQLNLSGSTKIVEVQLQSEVLSDKLTITAPQALFGLVSVPLARPDATTFFDFQGEYKAGSYVSLAYTGFPRAANMPTTKMVFGSDYSELNHYEQQGTGPYLTPASPGSVFNVTGVQNSAVYFKGVAAAGQTIGTASTSVSQTLLVKVDSGAGVNLDVPMYTNGIVEIINNGSGSMIDSVKDSVLAQLNGGRTTGPFLSWHETLVDGGRILWADGNGNGVLDGLDVTNQFGFGARDTSRPWASTPDFVLMETSDAHLAQFNAAIGLTGLNLHTQVVDPFNA